MTSKNYKYIAIFTALFLTACGGDGDNTSSVKTELELGDAIYQIQTGRVASTSYDLLGLVRYPVYNQRIQFPEYPQNPYQYILTETKLIEANETPDNYLSIEGDNLIFHYLSDIKLLIKIKEINIGNNLIYERLFPDYIKYHDYSQYDPLVKYQDHNIRVLINKYGQLKFPQGSKCYQIVETKWNQDFVTFEKMPIIFNLDPDKEKFELNKEYFQQHTDPSSEQVVENTWQNIDWFAVLKLNSGIFEDHAAYVHISSYTYNGLCCTKI